MYDFDENPTNIKVVGVGGAGCNAVDRMIGAGVKNVDFIAINTDVQALAKSLAPTKIQIGQKITKGFGAGADPRVGEESANEDRDIIYDALRGADMVFITCGMGGGTGTGAAPVIAQISKEIGALTVAVVTKPFLVEGKKRADRAEEGIKKLRQYIDTIIVIPNQNLFKVIDKKTPLVQAFLKADEVLMHAIQGMSDIITKPGLINVDFADVKTVLREGGEALMGIGVDSDPKSVAQKAINNPLVDNISFRGAKAVLVNISGGSKLSLDDVNIIMETINETADKEANIIMGACPDETMGEQIRVVVIATGFSSLASEASSKMHQQISGDGKEEKEVSKMGEGGVKVIPGIGKIVSRQDFLSKRKGLRSFEETIKEVYDPSTPAILRKNKLASYFQLGDEDELSNSF
ncbi:MAG: cell division protein FtsZ [Brevinematia bacterium]